PDHLATHVAFTRAGGVRMASADITGPLLEVAAAGPAAPPLSPAEEARFNAGRDIYSTICIACHQADGRGADKVAPSLVGSSFALGGPETAIRIVLHGKQGTGGLMPPLGTSLTDAQIASRLRSVRRPGGPPPSPGPAR